MKLKKLALQIGCDKMDDSEIIKEVRDCVPGILDDTHAHEWAIINIAKFLPKEGRTAVEIMGYEIPLCYNKPNKPNKPNKQKNEISHTCPAITQRT